MTNSILPTQTREAWKRELKGRNAKDAASCILSDMSSYGNTTHHDENIVNLAYALEAYASLRNHPLGGLRPENPEEPKGSAELDRIRVPLPYVQSVEEWERKLEGRDAYAASRCILSQMLGYRNANCNDVDVTVFANALEAYADLSDHRPDTIDTPGCPQDCKTLSEVSDRNSTPLNRNWKRSQSAEPPRDNLDATVLAERAWIEANGY